MKVTTKALHAQASRSTVSSGAVTYTFATDLPNAARVGWRIERGEPDTDGRPTFTLWMRATRPDGTRAALGIPLVSYLPLRISELATLADALTGMVRQLEREAPPAASSPLVTPEELYGTDPLRMGAYERLPSDVRERYERIARYVNAKAAGAEASDRIPAYQNAKNGGAAG